MFDFFDWFSFNVSSIFGLEEVDSVFVVLVFYSQVFWFLVFLGWFEQYIVIYMGNFEFLIYVFRKVYDMWDDDWILGFYGDCDDDKY